MEYPLHVLLFIVAGVDYIQPSDPVMVTFPVGPPPHTDACLTILLIDDNILESNEEFNVEIVIDALPIISYMLTETTVIIEDNDGRKISTMHE